MKIAFPVMEEKGLESVVYNHFGSARYFIFVDQESGHFDMGINTDMDHVHGHCQPMKALGDNRPDAVIVGGIGAGALKKLAADGISAYRAVKGTVRENLSQMRDGKLSVFDMNHTCGGHTENGTCAHVKGSWEIKTPE